MDETLSQFCFTDEDESKGILVNETSTEESEPECVHKYNIGLKYAKNRHSMRNLQLPMIQLSKNELF